MRTPTSCTRWSGARWALFALSLLALALPAALHAQPGNPIENSAGTNYMVAFPDTTMNTFDPRYPNRRYEDKCFFFIYSAVDNKVTIRGNAYQRIGMNLAAGKFTIVDLMGADMKAPTPIATETCKPTKSGVFSLVAESPIIVYQYMATKFGAEAWTAIPVEAWGLEYYAAAIPGEVGSDVQPGGEFDYNRKNKMFNAVITVIAAYDNTKVTIIGNGAFTPAGCTTNGVLLMAGECYQVESYVDTLTANAGTPQPDLGGSRIFADKPVGIISGNTRAQVIDEVIGLGKNSFKNSLIEWVPPLDQHGTQFVYMPTWDGRRPTGAPNEDPAEKRKAEFVRVYGTHSGYTSGYYMQGGAIVNYDAPIEQGKLAEIRHTPNLARVHYTDQPAQAFMHSSAVVKYAGTTGGYGGYIGAQYDGWGAYMVEMTPREQWVDFAPYYSSTHPAGMEHYINVVTDTNHVNDILIDGSTNFIFNRGVIEGTDLIWGSMSVTAGIDHFLQGKNDAKFYGFVYGTLTKGGHEEYRPGKAKQDDPTNPPTKAYGSGGNDGDKVLHPSEYEEYLGIAYGYPLAPSRLVVAPGDTLKIDTTTTCIPPEMVVKISSLSENPIGLRSVRLDNAKNAKIASIDPYPITGATNATVRIRPINPRQDASATVVIKDRSGKMTTLLYTWYAERLLINPEDELDFGLMTAGQSQTKSILVKDTIGKDMVIKNVRLANGTTGAFTIKSPTAFPVVITKNGGTLNVDVEAHPPLPDKDYVDTVIITAECSEFRVVVKVQTANPCVNVSDLDFGVLAKGQSKTMQLRICNDGGGTVTFNNPAGDSVITWLLQNFSVPQADIDALKAAVLERSQCIDISVTFVSSETGSFSTTARLWASTRRCRDTSVWIARVTDPGPQIDGYDWDKVWLVSSANCTKDSIGQYEAVVSAFNTGDAPYTVESIEIQGADKDFFTLGGTAPVDKIMPGDVVRPAVALDTHRLYQRVIFKPVQERSYFAEIVLKTTDGKEVRNSLRGIGIESHVAVQEPNDFGRVLYTTPFTPVPRTVMVRSTGTRDLHIQDIVLRDGTNFRITTPTANFRGITLPRDSALPINVEYLPVLPGAHTDELLVIADHARCPDDSAASLIGRSYVLSSTATGEALGEVLTCFQKDGTVIFRNTGSDPVHITNVAISGDGDYSLIPPPLPILVKPDSTVTFTVRYAPTAVRNAVAILTFTVMDTTETDQVWTPNGDTVRAVITGLGGTRTANAYIPTTYHSLPGNQQKIEVFFDGPALNEAAIDSLTITMKWRPGVMSPVGDLTDAAALQGIVTGTALAGWKVSLLDGPKMDQAPAYTKYMTVTLGFKAPTGTILTATKGNVLYGMPYLLYLGDTTATDLPLFVTASGREACATINTVPGAAKLDEVCGLNFRLISAFDQTYTLKPNNPNPFNATTDIRFSLGLDGMTKVTVYNASGQKVATLVDAYLNPGEYTVTWDAKSFPGGLYYCRIESGDWSRTQTMMLQK